MSEVFCDTSPLQYLYQLDLLHLLPTLIGEVIVPPAVHREVQTGLALGMRLPDLGSLPWVVLRQPLENSLAFPRAKDLGPGESEVLALALASPDPLVLFDDALARDAAEFLGIPFTGTLGLLIDARKTGLLEALEPYLAKLAALRFRISPALRDMVIELAEG